MSHRPHHAPPRRREDVRWAVDDAPVLSDELLVGPIVVVVR
jgi:hypothetical protein